VAPPRGIDHVVLATRDLEATRAAWQALGFTLTPRAQHPFGTDNALIQLHGNFVELLTVARAEQIPPHGPGRFSFGAFNRDFLALREGFSMLVLDSADAEADRRAFAAANLSAYERFDFSRQARLPDGASATVAFSLAFATDPRMPEAAFFTCQQHAPQYFWKPDYQRHAAGAWRIAEIVMAAETPGDLADFFEKLQGSSAVTRDGEALRVATTRGAISVETPIALGRRYGRQVFAPTPRLVGLKIETFGGAPRKVEIAGTMVELAPLRP
jgi:catechol 2,3-dioxygenase-like lactoylglutathione lyase family enzyme